MDTLQQYHPAEVLRYCPFCGAAGFEWDGSKANVCTHCGKKLYVNSAASTVAIIENERGELLLTRRRFDPAKGMLDLPGGFVDIGETAEAAIVREVKEELNLDVDALRFWATFPNRYLYGGIVYFTTDLVFFCSVKNFNTLQTADDVCDCLFLSKTKIDIEQIGLASIKNVIERWKQSV
ncbi:DNA mismatch repair protein MutT [Bacteroidia bacterium]|nr:DNA mismatch repair protein MutT [Bacteroidia bacterium]